MLMLPPPRTGFREFADRRVTKLLQFNRLKVPFEFMDMNLDRSHPVNYEDYLKAERIRKAVEERIGQIRPWPIPGDILAYTTEEDRPNIHHCHIGERFGLSRDTEMHLCRDLPIPFVGLRSDNTPYFSTSGGPWSTIDEGHSVALVGKRQRMMWTWTSCPGAGMGVKIRAWVNVWYTPHNPFKLRG